MAAVHWTEDLFLRHPEVFLAVHEHAWSTGEEQARDLHAILERFGVPADGRILDAPCGIGRHATRLAKMGYQTVGIDLSPVFVARAIELVFFSSRRRHTRFDCDWSSDVCSSDLSTSSWCATPTPPGA